MSRDTKDIVENIHRLKSKGADLRKRDEDVERLQELFRWLPQGEGSGLDADTVDGKHAKEIVEEAVARCPKRGGGGGGGAGMSVHGNEFHTSQYICSNPASGKKKITNIYWDQDTEEVVIVTE